MKRVVLVLVVLAVAGVAVWMWRARSGGDTPATSTMTQPARSGSATRETKSASAPARAVISVANAKGPIADAVVRLAGEDTDVVVLRTAADGRAVADALAPGRYEISASAKGHAPGAIPARTIAAGEEVTISLTLVEGGRALTGTVTDASGGPIAGARIDAARLGTTGRTDDAVATTMTAADGTYALTVAEGQLLVAASSPDYAAQARTVEVGAEGAVADFSLVPGGVIEGIVRDERSRDPAGGAVVIAVRDGGGAMRLAESGRARVVAGANGAFRISGLRPGAYELRARAGTRSTTSPTVVGIGVAEQVADVEILVSDGPIVSGVVVDEAGTPVANVDVNAMGRGGGGEATSGADGTFTISGMVPGTYRLMGRSEDVVPAGAAPIELADANVTNVRVPVQRGITITGRVEPPQSCEVAHDIDDSELGPRMPMLLSPTTSAADGTFTMKPASAGKAHLRARCASGDHGEVAIEVKAGMSTVVLPVRAGGSIAGRVVDAKARPVAGVTVMAEREASTQRTMIVNGRITSGVQGITNAQGAFELVGLAPGTYTLAVLDRGRPQRMTKEVAPITLAAADKKTGVELAVDRPDGVIEGIVTGPDGKPLPDAWVSVQQDMRSMIESMRGGRGGARMTMVEASDDEGASGFPPALTDAQGRFRIANLPHGTYEVIAEAQAGKLRGRADKITPNATITIPALGVTTLSGTVKGPNGPARVFTVEIEGPTTAARTFTDGTFSLGRVDPGTYTVRVASKEGNAEGSVTVQPNQPATIDLVLAANAVVAGTVVDTNGAPMPGVGVTVVPPSPDGRLRIAIEGVPPMTGPDGTFRVETKAGKGTLVVLTQPRIVTRPNLTLEPGKLLDLGRIEITQGGPEPM